MKNSLYTANEINRKEAGSKLSFTSLLVGSFFCMLLLSSETFIRHTRIVISGRPLSQEKSALVSKNDSLTPSALTDSLIGRWKIKNTQIEQVVEKMTSYGSQAERDRILEKQQQFQSDFLSLSSVFKQDKTYESTFAGQSDIGTWRVTRKLEIETMSKVNGYGMTFKVLSLDHGILVTRYDGPDIVLLLTFVRQ